MLNTLEVKAHAQAIVDLINQETKPPVVVSPPEVPVIKVPEVPSQPSKTGSSDPRIMKLPNWGVEGYFPEPDPKLISAQSPVDGLHPFTARRLSNEPPKNPGKAAVENALRQKILPVRWVNFPNMKQTGKGTGSYKYDPSKLTLIEKAMGAGGWRDDIGFVTAQVARWLGNPDSDAAFNDAAMQADEAFQIPWHVVHPMYGLPIIWNEPSKYRDMWLYPDHRGRMDVIPIPWLDDLVRPDTAHPPCSTAIMGLITGEKRWLWAGMCQASWHIGCQTPAGREVSPVYDWNARMTAWGLRDIYLGWLCARALNNKACENGFMLALQGMAKRINETAEIHPCKEFGIFNVDILPEYGSNFAPWQADMNLGVLSWCVGGGLEMFRPALNHAIYGAKLRAQASAYTGNEYGIHGSVVYRYPVHRNNVLPVSGVDALALMQGFIQRSSREGWEWEFREWSQQAMVATAAASAVSPAAVELYNYYNNARLKYHSGMVIVDQYRAVPR